jgi:ketosteroid isomerase-like protein
MGAEGSYRIGWEAVCADWKTQAEKSLGGQVHGEQVHVLVEGTMATATHFTRGTVRTAVGKTVDQRVRETSVFRKENGEWKMIGHQADSYPVWTDVVDR